MRENFIPNWTSQAFADSVQQLEQLVDELMDERGLCLTEDAQDECREL